MARVPRRVHEGMRREAEAQPTAAPTGLDRAFTRISASLTFGAPLQSRFGDQGPEALLIRQQSVDELLRALAALPPRHRILIRGRYFEGRQLDDLAGELGISKSWASRLHRQALERLRAALGEA
jgi:RNA polymerase sigma factor (sigma-70 family)